MSKYCFAKQASLIFLLSVISFYALADKPGLFALVSNQNLYAEQNSQYALSQANYDLTLSSVHLPTAFTKGKSYRLVASSVHFPQASINGYHQTRFVAQTIDIHNQQFLVYATIGYDSVIGEIIGNGQHWVFSTNEQKTWSVDTKTLSPTQRANLDDVIGKPMLAQQYYHQIGKRKTLNQINGISIVDVLLLYTPNIVAQFPGEMTNTMLSHLIGRANQAFVNSNIAVQLRLVGSEFVDYHKPSNFDAIDDLAAALQADQETPTEPSLQNIAGVRDSLGADIVAMIRTHDLDERDVCGIAQFPNSESDVLVNISNVGISGGSNCGLTFTHEIGHNFGAGHQAVNGRSVGALDNSGALIVSGKWNTVMSSIGTGDDNRGYKLNVFSNLENLCGGIACGNGEFADNASTIEAFAIQNANLRESTIPLGDFAAPVKTFPDNDGDGVANNLDAFPSLASETLDSDNDNVGDNADLFPSDPLESADNDNDGIGDFADTDDDNDGTLDVDDDLPFDASETSDADGDGVGDIADALDANFFEYLDSDSDTLGDISDPDDDNDGVDDFAEPSEIEASNLLVVNAASSIIAEYDAQTGDFVQDLVTLEAGSLTFRSDIKIAPNNEVYFIAQSDIYRFDRQQKVLRLAIDRSELFANFPKHVNFIDAENILITNDGGFDAVETFTRSSSGYSLSNQYLEQTILRDVLVLSSNIVIVVNKLENTLDRVELASGERTIFTQNLLDKPEHIAQNQQGLMFVTNRGNNTVTRVDANGFSEIAFLMPQNKTPDCIEVGPDEHLYICSRASNEILVLDSADGSLIRSITGGTEHPLNEPVSIAFVGKVLDDAPYDPNNDSDNDGTANIDDQLPLDPSDILDTDGDGIGNLTDLDDDNDSMPDDYEIANGFDPLDPSDADEDFDGDGRSNASEYAVGTNPLLPPAQEVAQENSQSGSIGVLLIFLLLIAIYRRQAHYRLLISKA